MPEAEAYEPLLTKALSKGEMQVELKWVRLSGRNYSRSNLAHIEARYRYYDEVISTGAVDGLIITGAPLDHLPFSQVTVLAEIKRIVDDAVDRGTSVLGLCWGALALGYLLFGVDRQPYAEKLFGVFETNRIDAKHLFSNDLDDRFWCAHSRYSGFSERDVAQAIGANNLTLLASSEEAGPVILASPDSKFLLHVGHPEYNATRLAEEYQRDRARGMTVIRPPQNVDLDRPLNLWRSAGRVFFSNWLRALRH